jgi:hypothetical protein
MDHNDFGMPGVFGNDFAVDGDIGFVGFVVVAVAVVVAVVGFVVVDLDL